MGKAAYYEKTEQQCTFGISIVVLSEPGCKILEKVFLRIWFPTG